MSARTGMELGFHVTLVEDPTAFSEAGMEAPRTNGPMYARATLTKDGVISLLAKASVSA